jgi:hypothetical protein
MTHSDDRVGEAMLQLVLDDPLLLIGRDGTHFAPFLDLEPTCHPASLSFQILHAYHILENMVLEYHHRSANFEIAFWDGTFDSALSRECTDEDRFIREQTSLDSDWLFDLCCCFESACTLYAFFTPPQTPCRCTRIRQPRGPRMERI